MLDGAFTVLAFLDFEMPEDHMFIAGCSRLPSRASVESNLQCPLDQATSGTCRILHMKEPMSQARSKMMTRRC